ncbi:MAG: c-type cytochrome [Nitrospinota bacterium]
MKRTRTILAAAAGLLAAVGMWGGPRAEPRKGDFALGKAVYEEICFSCHGIKGDGKGPSWRNTKPRPQAFANPDYMARITDHYMYEVVKYGKLAVLKRAVKGSPLQSVPMPSFEDVLEDDEIRALIRFERAFRTGEEQDPEIREIFVAACSPCHGRGGRGDGKRAVRQPAPKEFVSLIQPPPADYHNGAFMDRFSDEFLFWLIKKGRVGVIEEKGYDTMKAYGHVLSDHEVWSVVRYIREVFIEGKPRKRAARK